MSKENPDNNNRIKDKDPFRLSPRLPDKVNEKTIESEKADGAWIEMMEVGDRLEIKTVNTTYILEKRDDGFYLSGNKKYCPEPTKVIINGSTFGGRLIKIGFIGLDMHMEYILSGKVLTSSSVQEINQLE